MTRHAYMIKVYKKNQESSRHFWDAKYDQEKEISKSDELFTKQNFWPLLKKNLVNRGRYLDAGCGNGGWLTFLGDHGYNMAGIDTAANTIRKLKLKDPALEVLVASVTEIPYPDRSFDGILALGVLEYVENNILGAINEFARITKPGGVIFIEVPIINTLRLLIYLPLKWLEKKVWQLQKKHGFFANYLFSRRELKQLLSQGGFRIISSRPHDIPSHQGHYGLYVDYKILRSSKPYHLNLLGKAVLKISSIISPWIASTGIFIIAKKHES
jgi:SAM-dependent methyltransferase